MKRICLAVLLAFLTFYLLSFTNNAVNNSNINVNVTSDNVIISYNNETLYYDLLDGKYYKLKQDNNNYQFRIIVNNDLYLILFKLDLEYQLFGYTESNDAAFNIYLDNKKVKNILYDKNIILIDKNNENYYELFNILYTYFSKERNLNLSVSANSFQAESTSNAVAMASSDEYLDNYKSPTYSEYVDKTDDDIVKIIPKDYFFIVGVKSYYGKEFYVYIDTYNTWYNHIPIYVSQVYIVDIDVTKSNSTQDSLLDFNASGYPNIESNCGVYIEPVINEIYIGVKAENYDSFNISQVQNKTVLRNDNLKLNIGYRATPKYIVLDNFGVINDYADEKDKYNCIYHVKYRMEINKEGVKPNNISDMICSYIGTFIDICSILGIPIISDILSVFSTYWGLVDDYLTSNTGKAEYKIKQEQPKLIGENIAYFYNSLNADSVLFHMINFLDSLRERNALDYKYIIEIKNSSYNNIGQFTYPNYMSYSYSAHNLPSIKCLSYQHYGVYKIYTITTDSYCDTEIFIYNDKCGLIGYDDNSLYQDEDVSNYNASLYEPIGDDELVYIVCRTKTIYYNNNVELSLIKWS